MSKKLTYNMWRVPLNLVASGPPKVSSPLVMDSAVVGSNETPTCLAPMIPAANRLSVTVGTRPPAEVVPIKTNEPMR